jgi:hypothetical protein
VFLANAVHIVADFGHGTHIANVAAIAFWIRTRWLVRKAFATGEVSRLIKISVVVVELLFLVVLLNGRLVPPEERALRWLDLILKKSRFHHFFL